MTFFYQFKLLAKKIHWCCHRKIIFTLRSAWIFHFADQSFSELNKAPTDTLKVLFCKVIYYLFFNVHEKYVLYQFKNFLWKIFWCCQKILSISVKYFKICISKSFMRPRFFSHPSFAQSRKTPVTLKSMLLFKLSLTFGVSHAWVTWSIYQTRYCRAVLQTPLYSLINSFS